jgi:hypothetical protein
LPLIDDDPRQFDAQPQRVEYVMAAFAPVIVIIPAAFVVDVRRASTRSMAGPLSPCGEGGLRIGPRATIIV